MVKFLKILMLFITAIWGFLLGLAISVTLLVNPDFDFIPAHVPVLWIVTVVVGFIVPCFLVKLKFYKIAAVINLAGAVSLLIVHFALMDYAVAGFGWFYLPLLVEPVAVVLIAVLENKEAFLKKRHETKNAPAPSILGGTYDPKKSSDRRKK